MCTRPAVLDLRRGGRRGVASSPTAVGGNCPRTPNRRELSPPAPVPSCPALTISNPSGTPYNNRQSKQKAPTDLGHARRSTPIHLAHSAAFHHGRRRRRTGEIKLRARVQRGKGRGTGSFFYRQCYFSLLGLVWLSWEKKPGKHSPTGDLMVRTGSLLPRGKSTHFLYVSLAAVGGSLAGGGSLVRTRKPLQFQIE